MALPSIHAYLQLSDGTAIYKRVPAAWFWPSSRAASHSGTNSAPAMAMVQNLAHAIKKLKLEILL
jgi:hypothetical protein